MRYIIRHIFIFTGILIFVAFLSRISKTALYDGFFSKIQEISVRNSQSVQVPALSETIVLPDAEQADAPLNIKISGLFPYVQVIPTPQLSEIFSAVPTISARLGRLCFGTVTCRAP
jgi:hypothetical protein